MNEVSGGMVVLAFFIGIIVMLLLITIHELGHLIVAKIAKAYVYEFSIGFGPRLFVIKGKETWISVRAFPLGGYCSIASDKADPPKDREDEEVPDERKLDYIARWKKMFFILAGPAMNLFVALLLFTTIFASVGVKKNDMTYFGAIYDQNKVAATSILKKEKDNNIDVNYIGQEYIIWGWKMIAKEDDKEVVLFDNICNEPNNLKECDAKINEVNNQKAVSYKKTVYNFIDNLSRSKDKEEVQIQFLYKKVDPYTGIALDAYKKGELTTLTDIEPASSIGISAPNRIYKSTAQAYGAGWGETFKASISILEAFGNIFTGKFSNLVGPVGVAKQTATLLSSPEQFFIYVATISANLFILNLIFIPPLDGYRLLENFIEMILRKELPTKYKVVVNATGAILFLLLFIMITIKDFIV
ncbi:M50 family metallopeptidase [Spiroplasma cantharicola]|uniref:Inner membrane zinc metalloprotease n=1 Tax=Spiroplasma cantharicola TaxID=362837 RepID=A0A0M4KEY7_9MOLU|nr:site-2 protease family protein [Spiroplasma cantharicola]ALD66645.1 inner membrane zinc metalloprotease [Spiroplasma cantharicola]